MTDVFKAVLWVLFIFITIGLLLGIWDFSIPLFVVILVISIIFGVLLGIYAFLIVLFIMSISAVIYYEVDIDKKTKNTLEAQTKRHNSVSTSKETTQTQKIDLKSAPIRVRKNLQGYPCDNDLLAEYRKLMGNDDAKTELNKTVDDIAVEKTKKKKNDKENLQESKKIKSERNDVVRNNTENKNDFEYDSNKSWVDNVKKYWSTPEFKSKVQFLNF